MDGEFTPNPQDAATASPPAPAATTEDKISSLPGTASPELKARQKAAVDLLRPDGGFGLPPPSGARQAFLGILKAVPVMGPVVGYAACASNAKADMDYLQRLNDAVDPASRLSPDEIASIKANGEEGCMKSLGRDVAFSVLPVSRARGLNPYASGAVAGGASTLMPNTRKSSITYTDGNTAYKFFFGEDYTLAVERKKMDAPASPSPNTGGENTAETTTGSSAFASAGEPNKFRIQSFTP